MSRHLSRLNQRCFRMPSFACSLTAIIIDMLLCSCQAAVSAASVLATSTLPAAFYGSKVCSRVYNYGEAHLISALYKPQEFNDSSKGQGYSYAFSPAARELVREAGGFAGGRRWPLGSHSTLLSNYEPLQAAQPFSWSMRHYTTAPKQVEACVYAPTVHTSASGLPKQEPLLGWSLVQRNFPVLHKWIGKVGPCSSVLSCNNTSHLHV